MWQSMLFKGRYIASAPRPEQLACMLQVADGLLSDQQPPAPADSAPPAAAVPRAAATPLPKAALPRQALAPGAKAGGAVAMQGVPQTPFVATRQARASAAVAQQLQERRQIQPVMQVSWSPGATPRQ